MAIRSFAEIEADFALGLSTEEQLAIELLYNRVDTMLANLFDPDTTVYSVKIESYTFYHLSEQALGKIISDYLLKDWTAVVERYIESAPTYSLGLTISLEVVTP